MLYVTTGILNPNHAQAIQILAMAEAFASLLPDRFLLVSPAVPACRGVWQDVPTNTPFPWRQVPCVFQKRSLRYAEFALRNLRLPKELPQEKVLTRDIGLAFVFHLLGADVTYEIHKDFSTNSGDRLFRWLGHRIRCVAISEALKSYVTSHYGISERRVLVAHDGVSLELYDRHRNIPAAILREELGLPVDATIVLHTGSLYQGRGIELFEVILKAFPDLLCVSVGGQPEDFQRWSRRFQGYPNMRFIGHQPREAVVRYQMAADLLFFPMTKGTPTWWCASPLKLFEYLASGVPILGSTIGSLSEVLDGETAILFDPEEPRSVLDGVQLFLRDREGALKRARRGLIRVAANYTWPKRAERILRFIGEKTAGERPEQLMARSESSSC